MTQREVVVLIEWSLACWACGICTAIVARFLLEAYDKRKSRNNIAADDVRRMNAAIVAENAARGPFLRARMLHEFTSKTAKVIPLR